ncbi:MAG: helix-hairpin-helix domain-containing protein [Bacillota bacterium]|nr:helix-hairpin-helix domain-containing protein [Bacillota bacterium]
MKRILLFFIGSSFFLFTFFHRYQPVSLELVQPSTKTIEIKGAVKHPGIFTVKYEATVQEVIAQAGGLTDNADTSTLSLVRTVMDQEVLVVGEKEAQKKVSLNEANLEELTTLPGIGPSMAQKIMEYREEHSFTTLEQIMEIKGIKEGIFQKIKDHICL